MVLITPRLVRPLDPDEVPPLPTRFRPFLPEGGVGRMDDAGLVDAPDAEAPAMPPDEEAAAVMTTSSEKRKDHVTTAPDDQDASAAPSSSTWRLR